MKVPELPPFLLRVRLFAVVAGCAMLILLGKGFLTIHSPDSDDAARAAATTTSTLQADIAALSPTDRTKIQDQLRAHGLSTDLGRVQDLPPLAQTKIAEAVKGLRAQKPLPASPSPAAPSPAKPLLTMRLPASAPSLASTPNQATADPAPAPDDASSGFDPLKLSAHEMQVLEALSKRRETLNQREKELHFKSALLTASEQRINKKIEELKVLQKGVSELLQAYKTHDEENLKSLAKIYENMKPREAARILSDLETPVLLKVITHMREMRSSAILANMETDKARDVTLELARDHKLMNSTQQQLTAMRGVAQ